MYTRPKQKVSYAEKLSNLGKEGSWGVNCLEYYINSSLFSRKDYKNIVRFYNIYNNRFPEEWFSYVVNPYNSNNPAHKNFPARIREYGLLRANLDLLIGEYSRRPFNFSVARTGEGAYNSGQDKLYQQVMAGLQQAFINELVEQGLTEEQIKAVPTPAEIEKKFLSNYKDELAIQGQDLLDFIIENNYVREVFKDIFKDWLIAGEAISYKCVFDGQMIYERVSPVDCDYDKSSVKKYIEDGEWFVRRMYLTRSEVIDKFGRYLTEDQIKAIDLRSHQTLYPITAAFPGVTSPDDFRDKIQVLHVTWKSLKKVGFLKYINEVGQEVIEEVPENFKMPEELKEIATINWEWQTEVWEGYRIDGKYHVNIQPVPYQRNTNFGFKTCKLPYNGRRFSDTHSENVSVLQLGIPYLIMYIILHYKLELTIAKSKGKINLIDKNVIPTEEGWDEEKFFYYSDSLGWALIDRNQEGVDKSWNQYTTLDMGLYQHIANLIQLMDYYKTEWDELLGINRQRKGQTQSSDAVGNNERATFQSTLMSEEIFQNFEQFCERELEGFVDLSKFVAINGIQSMFIRDDISKFLNITDEYLSAELGINVTKSSEEADRIKSLQQAAIASASAKGDLVTISNVLASNNFSKIKRILGELRQDEIALQQGMAKSEQEATLLAEQAKQETLRLQGMIDYELEEMIQDREDNRAHIEGEYKLASSKQGLDSNQNNIPDALEIQKRADDRMSVIETNQLKNKELNIKEKDLALKNEISKRQEETKKYVSDNQVKVARTNRNKHDVKSKKK